MASDENSVARKAVVPRANTTACCYFEESMPQESQRPASWCNVPPDRCLWGTLFALSSRLKDMLEVNRGFDPCRHRYANNAKNGVASATAAWANYHC